MKKLKKLALLITVAIMLTLAACGSKAVAPTTTASEAAGTSVTTESTESAEVADTAELINQVEPDGSYENPYPMETREFPGTVEGLQLIEENCHFDGDTTYYTSADGKFLFSRFSSFLSVDILSVDGRRDFTASRGVILSGYHFVVVESSGEIWYINLDREWACFNYQNHSYEKSDDGNAKEPEISVSEVHADAVEDEFEIEELFFNTATAKEHRIAVATLCGTLICNESGWLSLIRYKDTIDEYHLPFPIREMILLDFNDWDFQHEYVIYGAVLENGTVVTIKIENSEIHVHVVHNGTMNEDVRLLTCTEENNIDRIRTYDDAVFFYINGILHVSDGEWDILVDDLPWSKVWIGDTFGPGKDAGELGKFLAKSDAHNDFDLEEEIENTGITY